MQSLNCILPPYNHRTRQDTSILYHVRVRVQWWWLVAEPVRGHSSLSPEAEPCQVRFPPMCMYCSPLQMLHLTTFPTSPQTEDIPNKKTHHPSIHFHSLKIHFRTTKENAHNKSDCSEAKVMEQRRGSESNDAGEQYCYRQSVMQE